MHNTLKFSLAALAGFTVTLAVTPPAHAAPPSLRVQALNVAKSKNGAPYKWGAAGPSRFDCSGLTSYAFKRVGKKIPRTAQAQYNASHHISKASRTPGDLVFFYGSGGVYHVAVYAGGGMIWEAPKPGGHVHRVKLWSSRVHYGRF